MDELARFRGDLISILPRLRRFALTLTRSQADADDLVQEACLRALSHRHQYDPTMGIDRWMFRITRNHWYSELRKRKVRTGAGQVPAEDANELKVEAMGESRVFATQLGGRLGTLPAELTTPLLLVSVEGYSYNEVAELLDIPVGTVMSRIHRARRMLAKGLRDMEHGEP